jgi:hypothetical protein
MEKNIAVRLEKMDFACASLSDRKVFFMMNFDQAQRWA